MSNPPQDPPSTHKIIRFVPLLVFAIALFLRLIGAGWGLPTADRAWSYHPDEPVNLAYANQISVGKFDFDPGFYNYGTLYLTMISVANDVVSSYSPLPETPTQAQMAAQMANVHAAGRWMSAFAGAGTALLAFLALRRRFGLFSAGCGAGLIAFAPGHVVHSRFQTVDVVATFFLVASAYWALQFLRQNGEEALTEKAAWKATVLSGIFAGLSAGAKYNGILILVALAATLLIAKPKGFVAKGLAGLGAGIATFVVTTPGIFLNSAKFWTDFMYEVQHTSTGHGLVFEGMPSGFVVHLGNLFVGLGPVLTLLALCGLVWAMIKKDPFALAIGAFFVVFYVLLGRAEVMFLRYTFPLYIGLAVGFAFLIDRFQTGERSRHVVNVGAILALSGVVLGGGLATSATMTGWMAQGDPRDQALAALKDLSKDKPDYTVGVVADTWFYSPPYFPNANAPRFVPLNVRLTEMAATSAPAVRQFLPPNVEERFDWDVSTLTELKPNAVAYSSFEAYDLERLKNVPGLKPEVQLQVDRYKAFQAELEKSYAIKAIFGGTGTNVHDMDYIRPKMWIWERKTTP